MQKWARDNGEGVAAAKRDHYERNREEVISRSKKWAESNPEKVRIAKAANRRKRRTAMRAGTGTFTTTSLRNYARSMAIGVCVAAIRKPYWRQTTSCL